ncbi:MAG TPA: DUF349 domain-containing protein [Actinocrinis sp.]|nr:DUF349 domain-containing protein [Actinocrinis sp.]
MSDGPEQTTAETSHAAEEVSVVESAVPEIAAVEPAAGAGAPAPAAAAETPAAPAAVAAPAEPPAAEPVLPVESVELVESVESVEQTEAVAPAVVIETIASVETIDAVVTGDAVETIEAVETVTVVRAAEPAEVAEAVETAAETFETSASAEPAVTADVAAESDELVGVAAEAAGVVPVETPELESLVQAAAAGAPASEVPLAAEAPLSATPVADAAEVPGGETSAETAAEPVSATAPEAQAAEPVAPVVLGPVSSQWGRVTEEGVVYAIAADGTEREIGNWAAGTPADGLAFYERKFASLKGEVDLLNKRVHGPGLSAKDAEATILKLRESLVDAHVIGDVAGLSARLDKIGRIAEQKQAARKEARAKLQAEAAITKEALVAEAEGLAESQQWKSAGERLRVLVDEWKAAPRLDRKADDELWSRFAAARGTFAKRRKAHFAQLDAQRDEVKSRKEDLVAEAESMADSTDWADTAQRFRNLMQQWKTAGRAQRETEDKLWNRFKAAQDTFFAARNADLDQRDAGFKENAVAKEALIAEAQKLVPVTDVKTAKSALRSIHTRWESIGMVPRDDKARIEGALRDVERAVSDAEQAEWKRTNPEARARAQATVDQLRTSIGKFEKELSRATEAGQAKKIADAEAAIAARQEWLAQAQAALDEFTR